MLAAPNRLRKTRDISRVYKRGVYGGAEGLLSFKAAQNGQAQTRAVIVVSKKVNKRAVIRNRIRRRLSAILATEWATLPVGYDIVISVHVDISAEPTDRLRQLMAMARVRTGLSTT